MSIQDLQSDLLIDLSTEQQQDVSGGFYGGLLGLGLGLGLGGRRFGAAPWGGGGFYGSRGAFSPYARHGVRGGYGGRRGGLFW
jgi:hypothetical protein